MVIMGAGSMVPELAEFLAYKTAAGLRPRSVEWYQERLEPILRVLGPLPAREDLVPYLLAWRGRRNPSQSHYRGVLLAVRTYLRHHGRELGIPLPRIPRYEGDRLSVEEIQRLLAQCRNGGRHARDYAILVVLLDTGLRASELIGLRWQDVDFSQRRLRVAGKGGHRRFTYFGDEGERALRDWQAKQGCGCPEVFCGRNDKCLTRRNLYRIVTTWGQKAGLRLHPHMLRRTFATQWVRRGGNIFALQKLLGHSTMEMVRRYVNLAEADLALGGKERGVLDGIL